MSCTSLVGTREIILELIAISVFILTWLYLACYLFILNSSVYLWDLDHGFAGVILIKKTGDTTPTGSWDSIHVFECKEKTRSASYKLTTTVMMWLQTNNKVFFFINSSTKANIQNTDFSLEFKLV